ncbi:DUF2726 domain-containing protein [Polyangium sp. y55x31]|uniref:DUF2726 domain-containing protein n=1 Tax=Polyangium sp. y55x31 TaxID=3042688 RepID=UPI0024830E16|nr:DUF2726 domain-containing protein [Polyangium sp. y55x31]MDI1477418.1 DUF2726 domain-containing protein [Polyangium sp. y55x31]
MNGNLKKLVHHTEEAVSFGLSTVCKRLGAGVLMRVKAQDVFRTEGSGLSDELLQFVARATFDYVAVDTERMPLFVVQFDGTSHPTDVASVKQQQENEICRKLLLPLVRVHAFHLSKKHHSIELMTLMLESWFASKGMPSGGEKSRSFRSGEIDLFGTAGPGSTAALSAGSASSAAEFDPTTGALGDVRRNIRRIYESGKCKSPVASSVIGVDAAGNFHAVGFVRVTDEAVASSKIAVRNQLFPATTNTLVDEMLLYELYQELLECIRGRGRLVSRAELGATIAAFRMRYKVKAVPPSMPPGSF